MTQGRASLFGSESGGEVTLTDAGAEVRVTWDGIPERFRRVKLDAFVVMPNHVHAVLWLTDDDGHEPTTLGDVVGAFKSLSTRAVNRRLGRTGPLWQRNYFERIVRDERELAAIRKYVIENPLRWLLDHENPDAYR